MKTLITAVIGMVIMAVTTQAQLVDKTGPINADDVKKELEVYAGASSKVVSLTGTAARTLVVTGRGAIVGYSVQHCNSAGTSTSTPYGVQLYDAAAASDIGADGGNLETEPRILNDIMVGGTGVASPCVSMETVKLPIPVKFSNGVVMKVSANPNYGSVTIMYVK